RKHRRQGDLLLPPRRLIIQLHAVLRRATRRGTMALDFQELLKRMVKERASDLFLKVGSPPSLRIDGKIRFMQADLLTPELATSILDTVRRARIEDFGESGEIDCAYDVPGVGRFRANIYKQRGQPSFAF